MRIEEYKKLLQSMKIRHRSEEELLNLKFANKNNPYKIGDIIIDHYQRIRIEKINYTVTYTKKTPICLYSGPLLKKNDEPRKGRDHGEIYQDNIIN